MDRNRNITTLVLGTILIAIGAIALFGQVFTFVNWDNFWPLIVVGVGAAFFVGMVLGGKNSGGLAVPGSILATIGLILLVINSTDQWVAWSYAWALIICGVGAGVLINGVWSDRQDLRKEGLDTLRAGLILFLIFGVIMGFIFSLTGVTQWGNLLLWAILLSLVGLSLLIGRILRLGRGDGERADLFWPILMIGVGVVVSLATLGWLPMENLWMAANLWPLLLIAGGLGLLLRGRSPWVGAVLGILVVAVIFVAAFAGKQLGLKTEPFWLSGTELFQIGDGSGERISGSGNVITENRPVSGFSRVRMEIPGNLEIHQDASEALTVSGEDNILPLLVTQVSGGQLTIRFKPSTNVQPNKPLQISLTVKNLAGLEVSSHAKVTVKPITTGNFRLTLSSSGSIEMEEIQADQIIGTLSSSGDIRLKGSARQLNLTVTSSGSFQAGDLRVQDVDVRLSSSGDVTVWAVEALKVNLTSSGNVAYYGSPTVTKTITSSGELISKGDK